MSRYPNIHSIIPLYHCHKPCKICSKDNSDRRIELRFNSFRGSNERYYVHQSCIKGRDDQSIMIALGCILVIPIPKESFLAWRRKLYDEGYGCIARINIDVKKGKLIPTAV